ncbi:Alpha-SNAP [Spironucleus salmonicida]|uniref:Alpha-SNAP n=1 Tax=Spironucleus salmonicida TaxID=348837 RepID=V6LJL1_9EUKA|nr:Alpha-SNAP [Spironucleus salmonicida]|eukprot:EST44568.1 Alpha-SNAP [Spironucleus salmonicida]
MSDYAIQASALFAKAKQEMTKKKFLGMGGPDQDSAIQNYEQAGNLYKMDKNYIKASEAYELAADIYVQNDKHTMAINLLNSSINCLSLIDPDKASISLEKLIGFSTKAGRFLQAGKACMTQAEKFEEQQHFDQAIASYQRATELFQTENNADSELRNAQLKTAELMATKKLNYLPAAQIYEAIGTKCTKIKLLQFHSRNHFLQAFLCLAAFGDAIAASDAAARFQTIDLNLEGTAEGDFMLECAKAMENKNQQEFDEALGKFQQRFSMKGNTFVRDLLWKIQTRLQKEGEGDGDVEGQGDDDML